MNFSDLGLSSEVLEAVADAGYTAPTPIQEQAIPHVLTGRDVLGCAQTGTGKTAGFTLPMIDILAAGRARARMPRSLILEPTRELAAQVSNAFETYGKYHKLSMALLIGGESFTDQERKLDRGVDVLIATPGRLIDLFERGKVLLSDVKILVIDEADRMLDMGFIPDVERIVGLLPKIRQTLFFSATMPPEIRRLADAFLSNPKEISVAPPASPAATVAQHLVTVAPSDKREALRRLIVSEDVKNAIIFCNRKRDVDILHRSLVKHGLNAAALHGDMPQAKRTATLERFKEGEIRLLVASDVAARGLDIQGMSHVFNFDVPIHAEDYVHRIGRTGRAGRDGRAFTIATPEDGRFVAAIAKLIGKNIPAVSLEGIGPASLSDEREGEGGQRRGRRDHRHDDRRSRDHRGDSQASRNNHKAEGRSGTPRGRGRPPREMRRQDAPPPITMDPDGKVTPLPPREHRVEREDEHRVLGFGDHLPAFLARPRAARG
jgi:superfamily II DNA/RNA helicase